MLLLRTDPQPVHSVAFSPGGEFLATAVGRSCEVTIWDLDARQQVHRVLCNPSRVLTLAFAPGAPALAIAQADGGVALYELPLPYPPPGETAAWNPHEADPGRLFRARPHFHVNTTGTAPVRLAWAPDGRTLACNRPAYGTWQQEVGLYRVPGGPLTDWPTQHRSAVSCLAWSPDGKHLATGSFDRTVRIAPVARDALPLSLDLGQKAHYLAYSPDGRVLAAGCPHGLVKLWTFGGQPLRTLRGEGQGLAGLCFSPDGRTVATGSLTGAVRLWNVATGKVRHAFDWGVGAVHCVAFAPDGQRAVAGGDRGQVVVWDVDDWES